MDRLDSSLGDEFCGLTVVFPTLTEAAPLPDVVSKDYEAALLVRHIEPNAYAVLVGRLLERICQEQGIAGKEPLARKLQRLAEGGAIPPVLAEMADQLRQIRNLGAHAEAGEVADEDVPVIAEFIEAIVEYLYRAPAKVETVRQRLDPANSKKSPTRKAK
jgi:hypothetical protein